MRQAVNSKMLESVGYDPATQTLEIEFKGKGTQAPRIYRYTGVTPELHAELMAAESLGKFFLAKIKPAYSCTRVPEEMSPEANHAEAEEKKKSPTQNWNDPDEKTPF